MDEINKNFIELFNQFMAYDIQKVKNMSLEKITIDDNTIEIPKDLDCNVECPV